MNRREKEKDSGMRSFMMKGRKESSRRVDPVTLGCRRSYDDILERQIGRISKRSGSRIQRIGILVMSLAMIAAVSLFSVLFASNPVEASDGKKTIKSYICVEIQDGDSLWSIAQEYMTEEFASVDALLMQIEEANGLHKDTVLKPGNKIMVPRYEVISEASEAD